MTPLDATIASIAHWEENIHRLTLGLRGDYSWRNCPLCRKYFLPVGKKGSCEGCPIMAVTDMSHCTDTPYDEIRRLVNADAPSSLLLEAAREEVAFLESVRDKLMEAENATSA